MHPDASQRAADVRDRAKIFEEQHFDGTSAKLYRIAEYIETGAEVKWSKLIDDAVATLREEYAKGFADTYEQYDFITNVLASALRGLDKRFREKLLELQPFLEEMNQSVSIMSDLAKLIRRVPDRSDKEEFYVLCVLYAMDVEGVFDAACRLLYVLYKSSLGQDEPLSQALRNLKLHSLREKMRKLSSGQSEVLFKGWENGHLRNAIAHMRFFYESDKRMRFLDDYVEGKPPYNETWSYEQMLHFYNAVRNVWMIFNHLMIILRVHDLAFAAEPFKA